MNDKPWINGSVPPNFWKNSENRNNYLKWLEAKLGYKKEED